jgi:hypothetical protein
MHGMNLIHVAAGDDFALGFWGIVIAIFVITQFVKARKKFTESAPQQGNPPPSDDDPAEELRKFLAGLGQAQEQPPPPPTPAPAPVAAPPPPRRVVSHHAKVRAAPVSAVREESVRRVVALPVPEETTPDEAAVLARYRAEMAATVAPVHTATKWRAILTAELHGADRQPVRKAIILREVFGAPTALRRREVVYPLV